jgi:uridine kinase
MDDYYHGKAYMKEQESKGNILNWDQPEALNLAKLQSHLQDLKKGKSIKKPIYCMKTSEQIDEENLEPNEIILLD